MKIKKKIHNHLINSFGIKTNRKFLIIESDDWGSVRMPSKKVYNSLIGSELKVENCPYSKYDALETESDLDYIFNILGTVKDKNNNYPIITSNFLVANPNFGKIKENEFSEYIFEPLSETYQKGNSKDVVRKIKLGIENKFLSPQFHGREHLNVGMWMDLLKSSKAVKKAFDYNLFALSFANSKEINIPYLASFMKYKDTDNENFKEVIDTGIELFNSFFGFYPKSFVAPVYVWDESLERHLSQRNFHSVQGLYYQKKYPSFNSKPKKRLRFMEKKNEFGQLQLVRNCFFEPSTKPNYDWVDTCLSEICTAFKWGRPAIICSHRLNFIGSIDENNRNRNLVLFQVLLKRIIKEWPDVEFVPSSEVK